MGLKQEEFAVDQLDATVPNRQRTPVAVFFEGLGNDLSVDGNRPVWLIRAADFIKADEHSDVGRGDRCHYSNLQTQARTINPHRTSSSACWPSNNPRGLRCHS